MSVLLLPTASVSDAWLAALGATHRSADGRAVHLVVTVRAPGAESAAVREVLDDFLDGGHGALGDVQSVDTVSETVFPVSLYADPEITWSPNIGPAEEAALDDAADQMYEAYLEALPLLRSVHANARGTYISRMISWPGREAGGINQLAARIKKLRAEHRRNRQTHNLLDIDVAADALDDEPLSDLAGLQVYAADDRRPRGFPCLTHIDLTLHKGELHMTAVYRHQLMVQKAYGNLLGLSALLGFLCQQSGYRPGELVMHATMADDDRGTFGTSSVGSLLEQAERAASAFVEHQRAAIDTL